MAIQKEKGFTLIETLVAIAVVLVAVSAVFAVAQSGLSSSSSLRNRIVATYLAEEAMDGVKNIKDGNLLRILAGEILDWQSGLSGCSESSPCGYDVLGNNGYGDIQSCLNFDGCKVKVGNGSNVLYRQMSVSGTDSGFVRRLWVEETLSPKEMRVTVAVTRSGTDFEFKIESFMYNYWPTLSI